MVITVEEAVEKINFRGPALVNQVYVEKQPMQVRMYGDWGQPIHAQLYSDVLTLWTCEDRTECPGNGQMDIPLYQIDLVEYDGDPTTNDIWVTITLK